MDMIKKIAITASTMLFVLAQIFSFYVIMVSQQEKIEILKEQQERVFSRGILDISKELNEVEYGNSIQDHIMTYCFRKNMPENSALYKDGKELHNSSPFSFDTSQVKIERGTPLLYQQEKLNGSYLLIFCLEEKKENDVGERYSYLYFYVVDITYIYKESLVLAIREILISMLASLLLDILLFPCVCGMSLWLGF